MSPVRVWIDAANSPHPPLFAPIARRLADRGDEIVVTARDHAQTVELARRTWPEVDVIGGDSPGGRVGKAATLASRIRRLRSWARQRQPDVAVSHNSYAQIVAARSLGIPVVTAMDFEHQPANHLAFRLARVVLVPEAMPEELIRRQGARGTKVWRYPGLKESIYLGEFAPNPGVLDQLGVQRSERRLVVTRTPPSRALYHRNENRLFIECLQVLARNDRVDCVVLTRHPEQRRELSVAGLEALNVPDAVVDARALLYESDLFLGAGGTMTREAALMGIPTLTVFSAAVPAVDRYLEGRGLMRRVVDPGQLAQVERRNADPRTPGELRSDAGEILNRFVDAVDSVV